MKLSPKQKKAEFEAALEAARNGERASFTPTIASGSPTNANAKNIARLGALGSPTAAATPLASQTVEDRVVSPAPKF